MCFRGDRLIGKASLDGNRVRNVFVDVDMLSQGIGRLLIEAVESRARENRLKTVSLHTGPSTQGFYQRLGHRVVERVERELNGIPASMIRMSKDVSMS